MMTPKEKVYWEKLQENPAVQLMVERLGLEPAESERFKMNKKIEERVEVIIDQIQMAPVEKRRILRLRKPWEKADLSWVRPGECPF